MPKPLCVKISFVCALISALSYYEPAVVYAGEMNVVFVDKSAAGAPPSPFQQLPPSAVRPAEQSSAAASDLTHSLLTMLMMPMMAAQNSHDNVSHKKYSSIFDYQPQQSPSPAAAASSLHETLDLLTSATTTQRPARSPVVNQGKDAIFIGRPGRVITRGIIQTADDAAKLADVLGKFNDTGNGDAVVPTAATMNQTSTTLSPHRSKLTVSVTEHPGNALLPGMSMVVEVVGGNGSDPTTNTTFLQPKQQSTIDRLVQAADVMRAVPHSADKV